MMPLKLTVSAARVERSGPVKFGRSGQLGRESDGTYPTRSVSGGSGVAARNGSSPVDGFGQGLARRPWAPARVLRTTLSGAATSKPCREQLPRAWHALEPHLAAI